MKAHLIRRGKHYAVKFYNPETRKWSHRSLKTTKKALADLRFGQFLEERHKKEILGELNVEPVSLQVLAKEFLDYVEANRSEKYTRLVKQYTEKWLSAFGSETLTTAITPRMIQRYAIARKKDKCKIKGTQLANATVNRDLAALKHMLHKAEIWGYVEISPGRRVENLRDDGSVRTDYYTEEQLKLLVSTAVETWSASTEFQRVAGIHRVGREYRSSVQGDALPRVLRHRLECWSTARPQQDARGLPAKGPKRTAHSAQCAGHVCAEIDASEETRAKRICVPPGGWLAVEVDPGIVPIATETVWFQTIGRSHSEAYFWSAPGPEGCGHGGDPRFARTSQCHADRKVLRASGAEQSRFSGAASQQKGKFITQIITQNGFCTIFGQEKR